MLKQILFCSLIASLASVCTANAQEPRDFSQLPILTVELPGSDYKIIFNSPELQVGERRPMEPLCITLASWLAADLGIPKAGEMPRVEFASSTNIAMLSYGNPLLMGDSVGLEVTPGVRDEVQSAFNDARKIIYLPEGWNGSTPAEISLLVRELVHHLQNEAGLSYKSKDARDKMAISAQNHWLTIFGTNLAAVN